MLSSPSSPSSTPSKPKTRKSEPEPQPKWKTQTQQNLYHRRLLSALQTLQPATAKTIKEAADSALALTVHGQTRWSRAILTARRTKLRLKTARRKKAAKPNKQCFANTEKVEDESEKMVNDRLKKLGSLVPGCRKLSCPSLLEEVADYVTALEVQVRAMKALTEALANVRVQDEDDQGN